MMKPTESNIYIMISEEDLRRIVAEVLGEHVMNAPPKWITQEETQQMLGVGRTTLYELRTKGHIRYTNVGDRKGLLYDRESLLEYLESKAKEPFAKKKNRP